MQNYILSFFSSFGVHIVIGVVLLFSFEIAPPAVKQIEAEGELSKVDEKGALKPDIVKAVSVNKAEMEKQIKRIQAQKEAKQQAEENRIRDLERRAQKAQNQINKNQKKIKDLDQQKKQAEAEAKAAKERQVKESARAKEFKKAAEAEQAAKQRAEKEAAEAKKRAEEAKKKAEQEAAERKRKEQEAAEKAEIERFMAEQLAAEQAALKKAKRSQILTEKQKYERLIHDSIKANLISDEIYKGKSCKLNIRLAPSGFVIGVRKLGGFELLCKAAERAVIQTETVPVSKDPDVFVEIKDIDITFAL
ncbi:cell envelope integrity protein TolA [Saccharobesus litoralis]|uniref:Cell envelope integrity protein TolA n=1 Tax=Saccharobesus litoralis TaxID=2172099 RepID=A0A2S0VWT5_9ALTE|nr:cell envelope integrity protein TolA [Saccharobesus litoralis]AWB68560.1 cell envelope integrity protein TolA [Saccharobesus litoralis]